MNILLLNHYAGSPQHGMEFRPYYLAREWVRLGHRVTIIGASRSHLRTFQPRCSGALTWENISAIRYLWVATPDYSGNGARRALNMLAFAGQLLRHHDLILRETNPDVVIASSTYPFDIIPALLMKRICGARLIFEVHDLWPLTLVELGGMPRAHPFIAALQWAENFAYRHADRVISLLPNAESHMRAHGLATGKFVHIPNGIAPKDWEAHGGQLPATHREAIENARNCRRFLVGYAGAHGLANALEPVLHAAETLCGVPITFFFVGQGPEKDRLRRIASHLALRNVEFLPPVEKSAIPELLAEMDALITSWQRKPIYRFGVSPNKLMDYMMAAKPIIQAIDASNDIVSESRCGITVPPEDPRAIADAVLKLMHLEPAERAAMGERGRRYVLARHDYQVLGQEFLEALEHATVERYEVVGNTP